MIRTLLLLLLLVTPPLARGSGDPSDGHSHGEEVAGGASVSADGAYTTSALSRRFEVVLRYLPVGSGRPFRATLYLADFATNAPVSGATITLAEPGVTGRPFTIRATGEPGVYAVERAAGFARDGHPSLTVQVAADGANDLLLLQDVSIGAAEAGAAGNGTAGAAEPVSEGLPWVWLVGVGALALAFAAWLVRLSRQRRRGEVSPAAPVETAPAPAPAASSPSAPRSAPAPRRAAVTEDTSTRP